MTSFFYFRHAYLYKESETGGQYNGHQGNSMTWRSLDSSG